MAEGRNENENEGVNTTDRYSLSSSGSSPISWSTRSREEYAAYEEFGEQEWDSVIDENQRIEQEERDFIVYINRDRTMGITNSICIRFTNSPLPVNHQQNVSSLIALSIAETLLRLNHDNQLEAMGLISPIKFDSIVTSCYDQWDAMNMNNTEGTESLQNLLREITFQEIQITDNLSYDCLFCEHSMGYKSITALWDSMMPPPEPNNPNEESRCYVVEWDGDFFVLFIHGSTGLYHIIDSQPHHLSPVCRHPFIITFNPEYFLTSFVRDLGGGEELIVDDIATIPSSSFGCLGFFRGFSKSFEAREALRNQYILTDEDVMRRICIRFHRIERKHNVNRLTNIST